MATYGLWLRRYAPFKKFGDMGFGQFEGDDRGPSTSFQVTSRTYTCIMFDAGGIQRSFANSSGTTFLPWMGEPVHGLSDVRYSLTRTLVSGPGLLEFEVHSEGPNPLFPKSPDIDTFAKVRIDFPPGRLLIQGEAFGDNFPALEIFLYSYVSKRAALLLDGRTTGGQNRGPFTRLFGSHKSHSLGKFRAILTLNSSGELAQNSTVKASTMPDY